MTMRDPLSEHVVILCGKDVSLENVSKAVVEFGFNPISFPPTPTTEQMHQLKTWLSGPNGLLVTSNLQFAGMEAPTCVFITKNIIEETGARSGLLRATFRLVVVPYTEDVDF